MATRKQYIERMQAVIEKGGFLSSEHGLAVELIEIVLQLLEQDDASEKTRKTISLYLEILTEGEGLEPLKQAFKKKIYVKGKI